MHPSAANSKLKTENSKLIYHPAFLEHDTDMGWHPERAARLRSILAALAAHGVGDEQLLRPEPADPALLAEVHSAKYIAALEQASEHGGGYWDLDTYIAPGSYKAATLAAGAAVRAVD